MSGALCTYIIYIYIFIGTRDGVLQYMSSTGYMYLLSFCNIVDTTTNHEFNTTTDHSTIREPHMVPNVSMPSASLFLGNVFQTPHTTDTVNITSTTSIVFESRHGLTIGFGRQGDQHVCGGTQR